jgi:hypothetical protein
MNYFQYLSLQLKKQRNMNSKIRTRKQIYQIVSQWQESGISRQSFCEQENYSMVTFAKWIKKEREHTQTYGQSLVPLKVEEYNAPTINGFEVEYPNGVRLHLSAIPGGQELSRLIHIYSEPCFH